MNSIHDPSVDAFRQAMIAADPRLSKFRPLPRVLAHDSFDTGLHGWTELIGNHDATGNLDTVDAHMSDFRPPQLSNCAFFDVGSHGALTGDYAMKIATRPLAGHTSVAIRRLCMQGLGRVQFETYVAYKTEAASAENDAANQAGSGEWDGNIHPSEQQFGSFTLGSDLCGPDGVRYHCVARYLNTDEDNNFARQWMYPTITEPTPRDHLDGTYALDPLADFTAPGAENWDPLGDPQSLCYNEVPTKVNWHYLRWQIDTEQRKNVELQVNSRTYDMRDVPVPAYDDKYVALENLLNFYVTTRTHTNVRNFLFVDSVLISADW